MQGTVNTGAMQLNANMWNVAAEMCIYHIQQSKRFQS
jgi:hypothetical protein